MKTYRIATIPGDGIGKEVVPAGQQVLEALARSTQNFEFKFEKFFTKKLTKTEISDDQNLGTRSKFTKIFTDIFHRFFSQWTFFTVFLQWTFFTVGILGSKIFFQIKIRLFVEY